MNSELLMTFGHIDEDEPNKSFSLSRSYKPQEMKIIELVEAVHKRLEDFKLPLRPRLDFDFIAKFVRVKKYDSVKAADAIKNYYQHIFQYQKRVYGIRPTDFIVALESNSGVCIKKTVKGSKIAYVKTENWDPSKCSSHEMITAGLFFCEEYMLDQEIQAYGAVFVFNMGGLCFSQLRQISYSDIKYAVHMGLFGVPMRLEGVHVVNAPRIYWPLHKLLMSFMPHKIKNRVHVHSKLESLHNFIDKRMLPQSLGGDLGEEEAMEVDFVMKILTENKYYEEYWSAEFIRSPRRLSRTASPEI